MKQVNFDGGKEGFKAQGKSRDIDDDHEGDWQNQEIKKLQKRISDLLGENADLNRKLQKSNYDQVYKENKMLQMEVRNMYTLQEENVDLREDLNRTKAISYDTKIKEMTEENQNLRRRNGQLLIEKEEVDRKMKLVKDQM